MRLCRQEFVGVFFRHGERMDAPVVFLAFAARLFVKSTSVVVCLYCPRVSPLFPMCYLCIPFLDLGSARVNRMETDRGGGWCW